MTRAVPDPLFRRCAETAGRHTKRRARRDAVRTAVRALLAVLVLAAGQPAAALEILLAHTPDCNSCDLFRRAAERRHYGDALHDRAGGADRAIPIRYVDKSELTAEILGQLPPDGGPDDPWWPITLTVLVVDGGRVLASGNIAESADNRLLRHSHAVMFPPAEPREDDPALVGEQLLERFFLSHWNLEYFVDVALGRREAREAKPLVDLAAARPWAAGPANVVLWGSAGTPRDNALFISRRIGEIRSALDALAPAGARFVTLYGHGPDVPGNDTSYVEDGRTLFRRTGLAADLSASGKSLNRVLSGIRRRPGSRSLLIQVGHSGPAGSPLWGSGLTLAPDDLAALKRESDARLVMVSGACNGGLFAKAVQCGFFAAHPDVVASGCQLSPQALETSDDYLHHFFRAVSRAGTASARPLTLAAAHWQASVRLEDHQISYTTTDALIDDYFAAHPDRLPASMSVADIRREAGVLAPEESQALATLTADLPADLSVPLTGYVGLNQAAQEKLADARELSSRERNGITAMPYKLVLPLLARREVYGSLRIEDPEFSAAAACEAQSIPAFLTGAAAARPGL